jgi:DNA-binding response OmpR family regulator
MLPERLIHMNIALCTASPKVAKAVEGLIRKGKTLPTVFDSGLQLLSAVRSEPRDLVVLDLDTPGLNALFLISAIQEIAPGLPIAAVSASSDADTRLLTQKGVSFVKLNSEPLIEMRALLAEIARRSRTRSFAGAGAR